MLASLHNSDDSTGKRDNDWRANGSYFQVECGDFYFFLRTPEIWNKTALVRNSETYLVNT